MFGKSTILNASITRISMTVAAMGKTCGQMISRKVIHLPAPSMSAASFKSFGTLSNAASIMMKTKGIHCQLSAMTMKIRAAQGSVAHDQLPRPTHCQTPENGPLVVSANIRKI